ncbi:RraA family protein [Altererythrobacter soli]|uniref:Putative 4-hydroxy-4-methyl-2-oxoglutarate aldolase n=1 Tax=Croceibacterium soli TaxID=1739690 RepID=A0A6I4UV87_9SPHN|nr:RraA family protein [Croceibacterium soli]MXP41377.1 RraA family protein [Croceibacterium soli]
MIFDQGRVPQLAEADADAAPALQPVAEQVPVKPKSSEMTPGPGFMIRTDFPRLPQELVAGFRDFETADVSDVLNRLYAMDGRIRNQVNDKELLGPACTVKLYPGDNLMIHKALDIARPGDIVVVDCSGAMSNAVFGDLVANKSCHRGIAGFVIDGLIRDLAGIVETGLPVYARGVTPFGPLHRGPGEINTPISCGGVVVNPGDIIKADSTGIAVVPKDHAAEILQRLRDSRERLEDYVASVKRGEFSNDWVDKQLRENGCAICN